MASVAKPCVHLDAKYQYTINSTTHGLEPKENFLKKDLHFEKDGIINTVIEIPAGCNDKWEVVSGSGQMIWDKKDGRVRFVRYINYPWNYGMVPQTLSGDGDPLDVVILGPSLPRASLQRVKVIGLMRAVDSGENDDKLVAVSLSDSPSNAFSKAQSLSDLPKGVKESIKDFFLHYKGTGVMEFKGWVGPKVAHDLVKKAHNLYTKK